MKAHEQHNHNTGKTDPHENMEKATNQHTQEERRNLTVHEDVFCCTICGGPSAVKNLRQIYHPESGRFSYEWTAQKHGLPTWLDKKMYLAIPVKKLQDDHG